MFKGRKSEIEKLNGFYEGEEASVAVVSGQLGVGKTALLREFAKDKEAIFFEAYETTAKHQFEQISKTIGLSTVLDGEAFCQEISKRAAKSKQLIIIDQYPHIVKSDPDFDKKLHEYIVGEWKKLPVKLILCSDAFMLVDKYIKGKKALWKNDITLDLVVQPLGFYDSCEFFADASPKEAAFLYGITGGIPYNLVRTAALLGIDGYDMYGINPIQGEDKIKEVVCKLFLDKNCNLGLNPEVVMATELRELSYYNYMLATLAKGLNRVNQISAEVEKPKDVVVPYLNSLMSIGVCTKDTAITEITNRKKTRYSIVNTSTLFWYKHIVANYNLYISGQVDELWNTIKADIDDYMKEVFIKICAEYLRDRSDNNLLPFTIEEIGNWWVNDDEAGTTDGFDLVSLGKCDGKSATIFAQCYYIHEPIEVAQLKSLIEKTKQLHRQGDAFYLVFSNAGFHENAITISSAIKNIMLITLDEMR
jgi:AAA+ ATPase superfamily predicted ATPase